MQKILIVDDEEVNRRVLQEILENDYEIEMSEDGVQALNKLRDNYEEISALLLDLQMPNVDGYAVISEIKNWGIINKIPILIISGDDTVEAENQCFEMGVADFIHKPFEPSIVKKRIKNTMDLFDYKKQLERKVEEQTETLRKQSEIIKIQAERLSKAKPFNKLMIEYSSVIREVETRLKILNDMFSEEYKRNPFESIKSRLKSPESIYKKLERKGYPVSIENIKKYVTDVAGVRVICSFPDDIYRLAELLINQDDIVLLKEKDYIKNPKPNGYRSLHLILNVPIFLPYEKIYMKVEVQFRTIAMDFWASLEHKLKYKKHIDNTEEIGQQLKMCADSIEELDYQMQEIRDKIDIK
ncbi:MAG: response regulator [Butyrivibrio sp.]|nr:response regulator [Butyrivibrio sp.]